MDFEELLYNMMRKRNINDKNNFLKRLKAAEECDDFSEYRYLKAIESDYTDVTKMAIKSFNQRINCGGYALEIDMCLFPNGLKFDNYVSGILDTFDFVRLLGDEPLQDDEYLVLYRYYDYKESNGKNLGHHFIKVNEDGLVVEKCGGETPRIFYGWDDAFDDSPEAVFAVKKDHEHLLEMSYSDVENLRKCMIQGLDFEASVDRAIETRNNSFEYHCRNYRLKKSKDGEIFITNQGGEIIADLLTDGTERTTVVRAGKEDYVENLTGPVKPIIENGKLVNLSMYKQTRNKEESER